MASHSLANARVTHTPNSSSTSLVLLESGDEKPNHASSVNGQGSGQIEKFLSADELVHLLHLIDEQSEICGSELQEEEEKRYSYQVDRARRIHNYEPFISTFIAELETHNLLRDLISSATSSINNHNSSGKQATPPSKKSGRLRTLTMEPSTVRQLRKRPKKDPMVVMPEKPTPSPSSWSSRSSSASSSMTGRSSRAPATAGSRLGRSLRCVKRARLSSPYGSVNRSRLAAASLAAVTAANRRNHYRKVL